MSFPDNSLERLLEAAHTGRMPSSELLEGIRESAVYLPVVEASGGTEPSSFPGIVIDGAQFVPAYSSETQLCLAAGEVSIASMPIRQLAEHLPAGVGIALNWRAAAPGLPITTAGVALLRGQVSKFGVGTEIRIGEPARRPVAFLDELGHALADIESVRSVHFGLMQSGEAEPVFVVGVEMTEYKVDTKEAVAGLVRRATIGTKLEYGVEVFFSEPESDARFREQIMSLPPIVLAR